jgi:hypothetical protein
MAGGTTTMKHGGSTATTTFLATTVADYLKAVANDLLMRHCRVLPEAVHGVEDAALELAALSASRRLGRPSVRWLSDFSVHSVRSVRVSMFALVRLPFPCGR